MKIKSLVPTTEIRVLGVLGPNVRGILLSWKNVWCSRKTRGGKSHTYFLGKGVAGLERKNYLGA